MKGLAQTLRLALALGLAAAAGGCAKRLPVPPHVDVAPHGGTPVMLGGEIYCIELVRDGAAGTLQAYVLDGEMENFVRIAASKIEFDAKVGGRTLPIVLRPVANPATGETVGDTSEFEGQADWLKSTAQFQATLVSVSIHDRVFRDVEFSFPQGNDTD